jgi:hypothetical protein
MKKDSCRQRRGPTFEELIASGNTRSRRKREIIINDSLKLFGSFVVFALVASAASASGANTILALAFMVEVLIAIYYLRHLVP